MTSKWSRVYWIDLGERTAATLVGAVITMLTADASGVVSGSPQQWWVIVGLPTVLAVLKGLLANLSDPESGASSLPHPPAPEIVDDYEPRHRGEDGAVSDVAALLLVVVAVVLLLALVGVI